MMRLLPQMSGATHKPKADLINGAESIQSGYYGNQLNVMQYILQARYDKRHTSFTHVTTNINMNQIAEIYGARIYDRALEMFNFVELSGYSQRKKSPII